MMVQFTVKAVLFLIDLYRYLAHGSPSNCIYIPTCSEYAKEAFLHYPLFTAIRITLFRILRCHPLAKGGFDPVK